VDLRITPESSRDARDAARDERDTLLDRSMAAMGLDRGPAAMGPLIASYKKSFRGELLRAATKTERGQGEAFLLVGSSCAPEEESDADAGHAAFLVNAMSEAGTTDGVAFDAWSTGAEVGLLAHAPPRPGESEGAHARRIARALGRRFFADPLPVADLAGAEVARAAADDRQAFSLFAELVSPGSPSRVTGLATLLSLGRLGDGRARLERLRHEPLRVAMIAPWSAQDFDAARRALEAYVPRDRDTSACVPIVATAPPNAPSAAHSRAKSSDAEAYLGLSFTGADGYAAASWTAALLDGPKGILAKRVEPGLATTRVAVLGGPSAPTVAIHIQSTAKDIDAALALVKAALPELKAPQAADLESARAAIEAARLARQATPRGRIVSLFRQADTVPPFSPSFTSDRLDLREGHVIELVSRPRK
jgi:hypothetical protein